MRARTAIVAALIFLGAPAAAQPGEAAQVDRQLTEAGRWSERLAEALTVGMESQRALNQATQAMVRPPLSRERMIAAAPRLRPLIEASRADLRRSNALLDALPPAPREMMAELGPQLVADARAHNARMFALLDAFDDFAVAVGKSDLAALDRIMPRLMEGTFAAIGQQRLLVRNRQATAEPTDSTHQSLGIIGQVYRAMEAVLRGSTEARDNGGVRADAAAAALRKELGLVGAHTRSLAATGRQNLERELAEIDEQRRSGDPSEAKLMERIRNVYAGEAKVFALGDRLVAFAEANKGVTGAQLRDPAGPRLLPVLTQLEADYMAISQEQAAALAKGQ
ncbi:MAG TPA: hypothetical protein VF650_01095 [Allosphingosinicella sp.]|jgi:hypothetical protein